MRLKIVLIVLVAVVLALPALGSFVDNGDGTVTYTQKASAKFLTGMCARVWDSGQDCSGSVAFGAETTTWVAINVCTQQESDDGDPLPTNLCTAGYVTAGICPAAWQGSVTVARAQDCAKYVDWAIKAWGKAIAKDGLTYLEAQRAPVPGDHTGDVTDP